MKKASGFVMLAISTKSNGKVVDQVVGDPVLKDPNPDSDFYYHQQFKIYHEPYLIWDREAWEAVLEQVMKMGKKLTAVAPKETLNFFLKSGFILKRIIKDYYDPGVDGYYIAFAEKVPIVGRVQGV
ncbi:MAG: hypothetical protein HY882_08190 [Deltaproteobacteria bacterium]|nr:hypothetical protein [Deltaproteobacteria bacterium]